MHNFKSNFAKNIGNILVYLELESTPINDPIFLQQKYLTVVKSIKCDFMAVEIYE